MDCRRFEEQLEPLLTGELPASEVSRVEAHRDACERCARLLAIVQGDHDVAEAPDGDAFVAALMRKTAGSPCTRAEANLCAWVDGELEASEADLVALHVEHCAQCAAVAAALRLLAHDLAGMAEIDPGPGFTSAVLARTRGAAPHPARAWAARLREEWQGLLLRPRAALELATAGCFVLLILCGLPFSPMREVPRRALSVAQINPVAVATSSAQRAQPLWNDYVVPFWDQTGGRMVQGVRAAADDFAAQRPRAAEALTGLRTHTSEAGHALWKRDGQQFSQAVGALGDDFDSLWDGLRNVRVDSLQAVPQQTEE